MDHVRSGVRGATRIAAFLGAAVLAACAESVVDTDVADDSLLNESLAGAVAQGARPVTVTQASAQEVIVDADRFETEARNYLEAHFGEADDGLGSKPQEIAIPLMRDGDAWMPEPIAPVIQVRVPDYTVWPVVGPYHFPNIASDYSATPEALGQMMKLDVGEVDAAASSLVLAPRGERLGTLVDTRMETLPGLCPDGSDARTAQVRRPDGVVLDLQLCLGEVAVEGGGRMPHAHIIFTGARR